MHYDASTKAEYEAALFHMRGRTIIGTTTIGELTIVASMRSWQVSDDHGNVWEGKARTGVNIRAGIYRTIHRWLKDRQ